MPINVNLRPELIVLTRTRVLFHVMKEMLNGLGGTDAVRTIQKGVLEQQLVDSVTLYYKNAKSRVVAAATISIDWERHAVMAQSQDGAEFRLADGCSIAEQISKVYPLVVEHTTKMRTALAVKSVEHQFTFRAEVRNDPERLKAAHKLMGSRPGEEPEWDPDSKATVNLEYASAKLEELSIRIQHEKP